MWGNPIRVTPYTDAAASLSLFRSCLEIALKGGPIPKRVNGKFLKLGKRIKIQKIADRLHEIRGKDLACHCPPNYPCHVEVLLEFANVNLAAPVEVKPEPAVEPVKKKRGRPKKAVAVAT